MATDLLPGKAVIIVTQDANAMIPGTALTATDQHLVLPPMDAAWFATSLVEATGDCAAARHKVRGSQARDVSPGGAAGTGRGGLPAAFVAQQQVFVQAVMPGGPGVAHTVRRIG